MSISIPLFIPVVRVETTSSVSAVAPVANQGAAADFSQKLKHPAATEMSPAAISSWSPYVPHRREAPSQERPTTVGAAVKPEQSAPTPGDAILARLQTIGGELRESWQGVQQASDAIANRPSVSSLLELQSRLLSTTIYTDVVATGIRKTASVIESLYKTQ